jgi:2-amino-4-hydroxy-6-hydroxymethyldihydropteridine diphosphokinase
MGEAPCFNLPLGGALVLLGLGSNVGDRLHHLRAAVNRLRAIIQVEAVSRVYESAPVGYADQPDFLNLVVRARTDLEIDPLFQALKLIERELGRERSFRNAPRTIDIDLLAYDQCVIRTEELTVPHPRMLERSFVLLPLLEVDPNFKHPLADRPLADYARELPPAEPRYVL